MARTKAGKMLQAMFENKAGASAPKARSASPFGGKRALPFGKHRAAAKRLMAAKGK